MGRMMMMMIVSLLVALKGMWEELACPGDVEVLVVLLQPASYLSYLVLRRHHVEDNRELRNLRIVWDAWQLLRVGYSLLHFPLVCLSLRQGVKRHLLLVFAQLLVERVVGDVG